MQSSQPSVGITPSSVPSSTQDVGVTPSTVPSSAATTPRSAPSVVSPLVNRKDTQLHKLQTRKKDTLLEQRKTDWLYCLHTPRPEPSNNSCHSASTTASTSLQSTTTDPSPLHSDNSVHSASTTDTTSDASSQSPSSSTSSQQNGPRHKITICKLKKA